MILLDTNVVSETICKVPNQNVMNWIDGNESATALPSVTIAEIAFGIERIRPAERSHELARALQDIMKRYTNRIYAFDQMSALLYGEIVGGAFRRGRQIAIADGMIAATALRHNATLATRNTAHFTGLGLELINPWD
jgi:predicted nucleic acid-binding protein